MLIVFDIMKVHYTPGADSLVYLRAANNKLETARAQGVSQIDVPSPNVEQYKNELYKNYMTELNASVIPTANENFIREFSKIKPGKHLESGVTDKLKKDYYANFVQDPLDDLGFFEKYYANDKETHKLPDGKRKEIRFQKYFKQDFQAGLAKSLEGEYPLSKDPKVAKKQRHELQELAEDMTSAFLKYNEELMPYAMTALFLHDKDYNEAFNKFAYDTSRLVDESKEGKPVMDVPKDYVGIPTTQDYDKAIQLESSMLSKGKFYAGQIPARSKSAVKGAGHAVVSAGKSTAHFVDDKTQPVQDAVAGGYNAVADHSWRPAARFAKNIFSRKKEESAQEV